MNKEIAIFNFYFNIINIWNTIRISLYKAVRGLFIKYKFANIYLKKIIPVYNKIPLAHFSIKATKQIVRSATLAVKGIDFVTVTETTATDIGLRMV